MEADGVILAHDLGIPLGGVDGFEYAVDIDLLQLVYQYDCWIPIPGKIARRHCDREPFVRPVAELLHALAGGGAILLYIGVVARRRLQHFRRHAPTPIGVRPPGAAADAL